MESIEAKNKGERMRESFLSYFEQMVRIEVLLGLRWMFGKPVLARKTVFRNDICAEKPANPLNSLADPLPRANGNLSLAFLFYEKT